MAKLRGNTDSNEGTTTAWGGIRKTLEDRVNASGRLVLGFIIFYSAWVLAAYGVKQVATSDAVIAMAAIAFWFGIVFAGMTLVMGIFLGILNLVSEARR